MGSPAKEEVGVHERKFLADEETGETVFDTRVHFRGKKSGKIEEAKTKLYRRLAWKDADGNRYVAYAEDRPGGTVYFDEQGNQIEKPEVPVTPSKLKGYRPLPEGVPVPVVQRLR